MPFELDPSANFADSLRPELFFAPPPQLTDAPPPDLFDQEVAELDLNFPFKQLDDFLPTFYDTIPVVSTPSSLTYSTDSHYSSDFTQSDYSIPSEIESHYSSDNWLGTHDFIHSAASSNEPPFIPPSPHPAEVQFDFGTSDESDLIPNVGISPQDLSTTMQPMIVVPTPLPVHATPDSEAQMVPVSDNGRPYKCLSCRFSSKRKFNLKTHIAATHNKSKPFKCSICSSRFSRKNDLDRHRRNPRVHRKQMSVSGILKWRFDPSSHSHKWRSDAEDDGPSRSYHVTVPATEA